MTADRLGTQEAPEGKEPAVVVVGVVLILAVAGVGVDAYFQNSHDETVVLFGANISNASPGRVVLAGLVAGIVLVVGVALLRRGLARARRRRAEQRAVIASRTAAVDQVAQERDALAAELARERAERGDDGKDAGGDVGQPAAGGSVDAPPTRLRGAHRAKGRPTPTRTAADHEIVLPEATSRRE